MPTETPTLKSNLTKVQLESLALYKRVMRGEMTLRQASHEREGGEVKIGALYRSATQGKENIRLSLGTVVEALALDYVKIEDVRRLLELAALSGKAPEADQERFRLVVARLIESMVA